LISALTGHLPVPYIPIAKPQILIRKGETEKLLHRVLIVATLLGLSWPWMNTTPCFAQPGQKIYIIGCDKGRVSLNQVFDPQQSIGKPGDKIANWHIGLAQKARYDMSFSSPYLFQMFAYRENNHTGKWDYLNVSGPGKREGQVCVWRMRVNLIGDKNEVYLLQAKPAPEAQGQRHVFTAFIHPSGCEKPPPVKPSRPCPPGTYDDGTGLFGQPNCVKKR
jgi:hypothetical protein